jgi:hypothetical protein
MSVMGVSATTRRTVSAKAASSLPEKTMPPPEKTMPRELSIPGGIVMVS